MYIRFVQIFCFELEENAKYVFYELAVKKLLTLVIGISDRLCDGISSNFLSSAHFSFLTSALIPIQIFMLNK